VVLDEDIARLDVHVSHFIGVDERNSLLCDLSSETQRTKKNNKK